MTPECPRGHELTDDNVRVRPGERSGRECLRCFRETARERSRRRYAADRETIDRARDVRKRAKAIGMKMVARSTGVTLIGEMGEVVFKGDLAAVEAWVGERYVPRVSGPPPVPAPPEWQPFIDVFVAEQEAARRRPGTIETRVRHLVTFARWVGRGPLAVTREDLIGYLAAGGWTPRTTHGVRASLLVFFRFLQYTEHRGDNPAARLPSVRIPRSLPRPCPDHVILAAYAAVESDRWRLAVRIAVETGMRRAEIAGMRTGDVEGRRGDFMLHVVGKGGHERVVPITDDLAEVILGRPDGWLFPNVAGDGPITPRWLGTQISAALPGEWTLHTLRHRFATMAYQQNNDLRATQELLGHASPVTTAIYTRVSVNSLRSAAAAAHLQLNE